MPPVFVLAPPNSAIVPFNRLWSLCVAFVHEMLAADWRRLFMIETPLSVITLSI